MSLLWVTATEADHVDLYHRTTRENAESIRENGFHKDDVAYFAKTPAMEGYGSSVVHVRVPEHLVQEDTDQSYWDDGSEVDDDDKHWFVDGEDLKKKHIQKIWHDR